MVKYKSPRNLKAKDITIFTLVIFALIKIGFYFSVEFKNRVDYGNVLVVRVIDGDTLKLENNKRVRLIGIDTPEYHQSRKLDRDSLRLHKDKETIQKMGYLAYQYTRNLLEGKRVRLEFDFEKFDKYDRLLAYVYLPDGTFINGKLVEGGYAAVYTIPPNVRYAQNLLKLQQQARLAKRGFWQEENQ